MRKLGKSAGVGLAAQVLRDLSDTVDARSPVKIARTVQKGEFDARSLCETCFTFYLGQPFRPIGFGEGMWCLVDELQAMAPNLKGSQLLPDDDLKDHGRLPG